MRSIRRLTAVAVAVLALGFVACDRAATPTSPSTAAPRASVNGGWTLVRSSTQSAVTVSVVLGGAGGTMSVNGHTLAVPAGALEQPTRITMSTISGSSIRVSLSAEDARTGQPVMAFSTPVRLGLSYASAKVSNPAKLKVGWLMDGSIMAVQASTVDKSHKQVVSSLHHFSDWGLITD